MTELSSSSAKRINMAMIAILAWSALALQLYLILLPPTGNAALVTVVRYFSYFTILTNLLVALALSIPLLLPKSAAARFTSSANAQASLLVYIVMVGLINALILRGQWSPTGLAKLADVLLHDVVPVMYVAYWFLFAPKAGLRWKSAVLWLAYPLVYMAYTLIHGAVSGWYPYFFIDVGINGYPHALLNASKLILAFLLGGLLVVAAGRLLQGKQSQNR